MDNLTLFSFSLLVLFGLPSLSYWLGRRLATAGLTQESFSGLALGSAAVVFLLGNIPGIWALLTAKGGGLLGKSVFKLYLCAGAGASLFLAIVTASACWSGLTRGRKEYELAESCTCVPVP